MNPNSAKRRRKILRFAAWITGLLLVMLAIEEIEFRVRAPQAYSAGGNAIWIRHTWIDKPHSETDYRALVGRLRSMKIKDVYFHAGPLKPDGSIDPAKPRLAAKFIRHIKKFAPDLRLQPWLGQLAEFRASKPIDLNNSKSRNAVLKTTKQFLDAGADGIHFDLEPTYSDDAGFLKLLQASHRLTHSRNAMLSVAAYPPEPGPYLNKVARFLTGCPGYWSQSYFLKVSKEVDQVAVMTYDTAAPLPGLYGRNIARTVRWAVSHGAKNLRIGIPAYDSKGIAHLKYAENVDSALIGLKRGTAGLSLVDKKKVGAAIFAEWTISDSERRSYREMWLGK